MNVDGSLTDTTLPELGDSLQYDSDEQELEADNVALRILRKGSDVSSMVRTLGRLDRQAELAIQAKRASKSLGVSEGHFALSYGRETRDWQLTQQALKFIEKPDAIDKLEQAFEKGMSGCDLRSDDLEFLNLMRERY